MAKKEYKVKSGTYNGTDNADIFTTTKNAGKFTINAKGGNDKITVSSGKKGSRVNVGTGIDTVKVTGGKVDVITLSGYGNTVDITGGRVNKITATKMKHKSVNEITVKKQKNIIINMTDGQDKITVNGIHNDIFSKVSKAKIVTRSDNDVITINKGGFNRINTGLGKDKVTINVGSNHINTSSGMDTITVNGKYGNYINAGDDNDKITLGKDARSCVVEGGSREDTITVKSKYSGKIGNLVKGGSGKDTYNIYYTGQTIVVDARGDDSRDTLNIYADSTALGSLKYYKKNDVLEINGNAHILGLKYFGDICIKVPEYDFKIIFTPKEIIADADQYNEFFDINDLLKPYNAIKNDLSNNSVSSTTAKYLGYKG